MCNLKIERICIQNQFMRYIACFICSVVIILMAFRSPSEFVVSGKITDQTGRPLGGVAVMVKGTSNGVTTGQDGRFELKIRSEKAVLVITYIGFDTKEVNVSSKKTQISITMQESNQRLEEVVVIGYSARRRKNVTGSVKSIAGSPLAYSPAYDYSTTQQDRYVQESEHFNREGYDAIRENRFQKVSDQPLSTFSIDVDAASYSNVRRMLNAGQLPPAAAVRVEEMINYFEYEYPKPVAEDPFSINTEMADCPWNKKHKLVLVGLQGKKVPVENLPASNIVFLIDVSGSMDMPNKLPLVKQSIKLLTERLRKEDKVAIVVYAGSAGLVLPSTSGAEKTTIKDAVDRLEAGGSTAGGAGIKLAYNVAREQFLKNGNNRIILCTDGDFNVGASSDDELERMIEEERKSGVFLTVLGYGTGNYQDAKMQKLANKGNGNHAYIDGFNEARKVLVNEFGGTLFTIAKDVKLQIEFNPRVVQAYRLIGYENRMLNKEDFNNDKKDAGELGSGHTVTALYEIVPVGVRSNFVESVDPLKYQSPAQANIPSSDLMTIKFRYKKPDGDKSLLIEHVVNNTNKSIAQTSDNFRFAASVAQFGMLLRNSEFRQDASFSNAWKLANGARAYDPEGYRAEFLKLLKNAQSLVKNNRPINEEEEEEDLSKR